MPTILELYDKGQRQFPMRGGGVSPVLEWKDNCDVFVFKHDETDGIYFTDEGKAAIEEFWLPSMDLISEPLPELETLKAKYDKAIKENCEFIAQIKSLGDSNAKLIARIDSIEKAWDEWRKGKNHIPEKYSDSHKILIGATTGEIRAITKAIKGTDDENHN